MLDIHTHYDVEVLNGPALAESLRHGVTTVMLGSCSLSTIHVDGEDAGDLFGRVEAIPREHVIGAVDEHKTWTNVRGVRRRRWKRGRSARTWPRSSGTPTCAPPSWALTAPRRSANAHQERTGRDGADARRGAARPGFVGMSSHATAFRQARRRGLPVAHAAVDLCEAARAAQAEVAAAQRRPRPAVRARHPESAQPRLAGGAVAWHLPQPAQDQPAVGRRRQVQPVRDHGAWARSRGWSTGSAATSAGSTCRCRSRCTPTASTW